MDETERRMYLLHSRLPAFQKKVDQSLSLLREAKAKYLGKWGVSYSGGKDSTVALDLAYQVFGDELEIVWQSYGIETVPGNREMAEWTRDHYGLTMIEHEAPGELEAMKRSGGFFLDPETKEQKEAVRWWWKESFQKLDEIIRKRGWTGHVMGLRAEESKRRRMSIGRHGSLFYNKTQKLYECLPLAHWTGKDVWAYIVSRGLKYNPIYDFAKSHQDRERIRNDIVFLSGTGSIRHGQFVFFRQLWPEWFNRLADIYPEIKRYV